MVSDKWDKFVGPCYGGPWCGKKLAHYTTKKELFKFCFDDNRTVMREPYGAYKFDHDEGGWIWRTYGPEVDPGGNHRA